MTIIALVALLAMAMEEMSEASSSTSFAMEESTRMARMILNNNKSSTKFFMKGNNKDEGVSCFDGLYDVPRKKENVLGKKNKGNSEIKVKVKGGSLVEKSQDKKGEFSFQICGCTTHFTSLLYIPWQVVEVAPFFGEEVMAITSGGGMQGPSSPINF